ncbi:MAG: DUF3987 domain-containing protein [Anaerolineae bacterium]
MQDFSKKGLQKQLFTCYVKKFYKNKLGFQYYSSFINELSPRSLCLDTDAKRAWIQFHDELDKSMKKDGSSHAIRRTANKSAEQALRIAGMLTRLCTNFRA